MYKMITGMVLLSKEEWAAIQMLKAAVQHLLDEDVGEDDGVEEFAADALKHSKFIDQEGGN